VPHLLLDRNGLQFIPVFDARGVVGVLSDELSCLIEVGSIMPARLKKPLEHLASTAREIDTAVVGFTSPVPLVGFRTPPISLSNTLSAALVNFGYIASGVVTTDEATAALI